MPFSHSGQLTAIVQEIERIAPASMLDVGTGMGQYGFLARMNLENINQAYVGTETSKANGFIPFLGLEKEKRYAEVLGHELAHAIHILTDLERVRMVEDVIQQTNQMLLASRQGYKVGGLAAELKRRLFRRDVLLKSLEEQAEEMERVVWQELIAKPLSTLRQAGKK